MSQQEAGFNELCGVQSDVCLVRGSSLEEDIAPDSLTVPHVRRQGYGVTYADALVSIHDEGVIVTDAIEALLEPESTSILKSIASLFAGLHSGIKRALGVRVSESMGSSRPLPPVLPHSFVKI